MVKRVPLALAGVLSLVSVTHAGEPSAPARQVDLIRSGRAVYQQYCASCHGVHGEGAPNWQQPDALGEMPPPPHDAKGHTWKHGDGMLYRLVHDGWRDPFNKTTRLTMPSFGAKLTPLEIRSVIEYIKTMWTPEQRAFQRAESRRSPFPPDAR
ncbi:cytochrome c (plasmid) [Burkholderia thailandensis]|uniref:c-type cytochrome n=1 Tax=Burkholderia thailandensis TaxID=57975 RepID=UPI00192E0964|nr:c-type cytochrome [Burkholderia thailandensis]MBS2132250.1 cytochrome c [Burkholderia thailandensis]QRA15342.1 cytochrome c [Burkholderia thailandensis]